MDLAQSSLQEKKRGSSPTTNSLYNYLSKRILVEFHPLPGKK